ncbi:MAG: hypothetical protein AAF585_06210, partial [Verrucomicrobiota bacterium]
MGSVTVGNGVSVGPAGGNTNLVGYGISVDDGQLGFVTNGVSAAAGVNVGTTNDIVVTNGQIGHREAGNMSGNINLIAADDLNLTNSLLGHDDGQNVAGDITARLYGDIDLVNSTIGHRIDSGGTYLSGDTFVGVGQVPGILNRDGQLRADANSSLFSAPA